MNRGLMGLCVSMGVHWPRDVARPYVEYIRDNP